MVANQRRGLIGRIFENACMLDIEQFSSREIIVKRRFFHPNLNNTAQFESFGFGQKCREFLRTRSPPQEQTNDNSLTHFFREIIEHRTQNNRTQEEKNTSGNMPPVRQLLFSRRLVVL